MEFEEDESLLDEESEEENRELSDGEVSFLLALKLTTQNTTISSGQIKGCASFYRIRQESVVLYVVIEAHKFIFIIASCIYIASRSFQQRFIKTWNERSGGEK